MKKLFTLLLLSGYAVQGFGQAKNYQNVRSDFGFTVLKTFGALSSMGGGIFSEIKFNATDQLSIGPRFEVGLGFGSSTNESNTGGSASGFVLANTLIKAEYFFTTTTVRPFAGLGLGYYGVTAASASVSSGSGSTAAYGGGHFGVMPQIGVNFNWFRLAMEYNYLFGGKSASVSQSASGGSSGVNASQSAEVSDNANFSYIGFDIAFRIGGKPKKKNNTSMEVPAKVEQVNVAPVKTAPVPEIQQISFDSGNKVKVLTKEMESELKLFPKITDFVSATIDKSASGITLHITTTAKNINVPLTEPNLQSLRTKVDAYMEKK